MHYFFFDTTRSAVVFISLIEVVFYRHIDGEVMA